MFCIYSGTKIISGFNRDGNPTSDVVPNAQHLTIICQTDNETLNYSGNRRLKVGVEYEAYVNAGIDDDDNLDGSLKLQFMLEDKSLELTSIEDVFD